MKIRNALCLSLLALAGTVCAADAPRLAVVDSKAVFDGYLGTKEAQAKYDKQVASWEQEVADRQKELVNLKEKFEKQSLMLSEEKKRKLQDQFQQKQSDLQKLVSTLYGKDGKVLKENEKFTGPIVQKIRTTVQTVAKSEGYDFVFDRGAGAVFYWKDDADLTQKVLDRLNSDYGGSTNAPRASAPASAPAATPATPAASDPKALPAAK